MTQYARIVTQEAWLGKEYGERLARRLFGNNIVDALPRNVKGKYIGQHKASIEYRKVEEGGWVRSSQRVERRVGQILDAQIVLRPFRGSPVTLHSYTIETGVVPSKELTNV